MPLPSTWCSIQWPLKCTMAVGPLWRDLTYDVNSSNGEWP